MKRILCSDFHLHPWSYGSETNNEGFNTRLVNQYHAAREMINNAEENAVKYIYFCGDLVHQHSAISLQVLTVASRIFKEIRKKGIKIRIIVGNHDQANREGNIHALSFLEDEEISEYWNDDGLEIHGLSYTTDEEKLKRFLGEMSKGGSKMVLLHQGVAGVPLSSGYVLDDKLTPAMIPDNVKAFTGHYHFFKEVTSNLTVVGNLTPLNWSDIDQKKGWLIWNDETNEIEQRIQNSSPNFISWDSEGNTDLSILENNYIRYISSVEAKDQEEIRKQLIKEGARTVEFPNIKLDKKTCVLRASEKITVDSMIKTFEDKCNDRRKIVGKEIRENSYNATT